jgi:hypothetical protein
MKGVFVELPASPRNRAACLDDEAYLARLSDLTPRERRALKH